MAPQTTPPPLDKRLQQISEEIREITSKLASSKDVTYKEYQKLLELFFNPLKTRKDIKRAIKSLECIRHLDESGIIENIKEELLEITKII